MLERLPSKPFEAASSVLTSPTATNNIITQADLPERKPRKSVAFSEGATIVDSNGDVTESIEINGGKSSAESHAPGEHTHLPSRQHALTSGTYRRRQRGRRGH